jgi:hypothetical protein
MANVIKSQAPNTKLQKSSKRQTPGPLPHWYLYNEVFDLKPTSSAGIFGKKILGKKIHILALNFLADCS